MFASLSRKRPAIFLYGTAIFGLPAVASAQSDDRPAAVPAAATPATAENSDIVVTAQRRSESLSKVPVAVSAFDSETLKQRVVTREQDLAALVPGLTVKNGQNANQLSFTLRGQTLDPFSGASPAVLTYINEAPFSGGNTATAFFDFSSIQVLKGPQGTLFGRNASGGAVLYTTTMPGDDFGGYAIGRLGERDLRQLQGAIDVPVIPGKIAVRVAGDYIHQRGYLTNSFTGHTLGNTENASGRITVVLTPTDTLKNTTLVQYSHFGGSEANGELYSYHRVGETNNGYALTTTLDTVYGPNSPFAPIVGNGPPGPGRFPGATAGYLAYQKAHPFEVFLSYDLPHNAHTTFVSNTTALELGSNLTLKNIFAYGESFARTPGILSGSPFGGIDLFNFSGLGNGPPGGETFHNERYSDELQLQGKAFDGKLTYIAGAFLSQSTDNNYIPVVVGPELPTPLADIAYAFRNTDRSRAIFAQGTYSFTDKLSFTAGGRYTWEHVGLTPNPGNVFPAAGVPGVLPPFPVEQKDLSDPSWTLSLQYQADPDNLIYFAQRGSFRAGNYNGTTIPYGGLNFFGNEHTYDFELGYKFSGRVMDRPAHFNVALYDQVVKSAQHAVYAIVGGNPAGFTVNVPEARIRGVEVAGDFNPTSWLRLGLSGAYTDAKYTRGIVSLAAQTGTPGYTVPFDSYPDTPKWTGSLYADVTLPTPAEWGAMNLRADSFSQTSTYFASNSGSIDPRVQILGYTTVNVRYSWTEIFNSKVSAGLYLKNALNRFYYQSGYVEGASGGFNTAIPGEPRTFGAELSVKF